MQPVPQVSRRKTVSSLQLIVVLHLLVGVTWLPNVVLAFHKSALSDDETGTVIVFFPIGSSASDNYHRIVRAQGAFVGYAFFKQGWIAYSYEPGFVRRLKEGGAWAVLDPILLNPAALLGCGPLPKANELSFTPQTGGEYASSTLRPQ